MKPVFIVLIAIAAALLLLFSVYLYLIMPKLRRKKAIRKFAAQKYAHRGLHGDGAAENSLTAFRRAVEAGYGIELDVRLSKDGVLVVFHDDTLDRVTGEVGRVDSRTAAELGKINLSGTADTIPTFEEVLKVVNGRVPLLVELKEDAGKYGVTEKTLEMLKEYKGEYIIESFNPLALGRVKKLAPNVMRGFLSQNFLSQKKYRSATYFLLQNLLLNVVCRPDFIAYKHSDYKNASLRLVKALFKPATLAWTVRSKTEEDEAYLHGFDGVIFENYVPGGNDK